MKEVAAETRMKLANAQIANLQMPAAKIEQAINLFSCLERRNLTTEACLAIVDLFGLDADIAGRYIVMDDEDLQSTWA